MCDSLAQLVELRIPDPKVGSSSLSRVTANILFACSKQVRTKQTKESIEGLIVDVFRTTWYYLV